MTDKLLTQAHAATKALEGISDGGNNIKASWEVYNKDLLNKKWIKLRFDPDPNGAHWKEISLNSEPIKNVGNSLIF